jgi:hypothetical protein
MALGVVARAHDRILKVARTIGSGYSAETPQRSHRVHATLQLPGLAILP